MVCNQVQPNQNNKPDQVEYSKRLVLLFTEHQSVFFFVGRWLVQIPAYDYDHVITKYLEMVSTASQLCNVYV